MFRRLLLIVTIVTINRSRRNIESSLSERVRRTRRRVDRQLDVAGEIHLHAMSLPDGDCRKPVEKPVHHLHRSLRRRIADTARDDDGSVSFAATQTSTSQVLGQAADQSNRSRGSKRG